jgi:hypothetical protein
VVRVLAIAFSLTLAFLICFGVFRGSVAGGVFHRAHDLLRFALDLLSGAFYLCVGVAGPLADLALRASCSIVD